MHILFYNLVSKNGLHCYLCISCLTTITPLHTVSRLAGCYESLEGGNTGDAVVDFSGAVSESIDLEEGAYFRDQEKQEHLFNDMLKVYDRGGIISCSIKVLCSSSLVASFSLFFR